MLPCRPRWPGPGVGAGVRAVQPRFPHPLAQRQGGVALGVSPRLDRLPGLDAQSLELLPLRRELRCRAGLWARAVPRSAKECAVGEIQLLAESLVAAPPSRPARSRLRGLLPLRSGDGPT